MDFKTFGTKTTPKGYFFSKILILIQLEACHHWSKVTKGPRYSFNMQYTLKHAQKQKRGHFGEIWEHNPIFRQPTVRFGM